MKNKQIKWLVVTGLGAICIILIAAIASQFKTEAPKDVAVASSSVAQVSPVTVTPSEASKTEKDIVIQDSKAAQAAKTTTQAPNTAVSSGTKQTIQPDPVKPKTPTAKPKSKDKTSSTDKKPTITGKPKTAAKDSTTGKTEPKGGEKKDGKIYVPGFGWIKDNGGGVQQEQVGSDGDINKQVGEMD